MLKIPETDKYYMNFSEYYLSELSKANMLDETVIDAGKYVRLQKVLQHHYKTNQEDKKLVKAHKDDVKPEERILTHEEHELRRRKAIEASKKRKKMSAIMLLKKKLSELKRKTLNIQPSSIA